MIIATPLPGRAALRALCLLSLACAPLGCGDDSAEGPMLVTPPATTPTPPAAGTVAPPPTPTPTPPPLAPASPAPGATGDPTFSAIYREIFTVGAVGNCMFGACHGGDPDPDLNGNLRIAFGGEAEAYAGMVGVVSTSTLCMGKTLVIPGDSANSLLMQKLGDSPPCGFKMPIGPPLNPDQLTQIATWIDNGALDD